MVYNFEIYSGADTFGNVVFTEKELSLFSFSELVVVALSKTIHDKPLSVIYFDNWFSPDVVSYLRQEMGILSMATVRADRLRNATFSSDKGMKKNCHAVHNPTSEFS